MQPSKKKLLGILEEENNLAAAAQFIYDSRKSLAVYVITVGLDTIKAELPQGSSPRQFKQAIKPQFKPGPVTGSVVFTKKTKERLAHHANELFGDKGWAIGGVWLRDMTKEQLLDRAQVECKSAKGSLQNAQFYEALAQPLSPRAACLYILAGSDCGGVARPNLGRYGREKPMA